MSLSAKDEALLEEIDRRVPQLERSARRVIFQSHLYMAAALLLVLLALAGLVLSWPLWVSPMVLGLTVCVAALGWWLGRQARLIREEAEALKERALELARRATPASPPLWGDGRAH